MCFPQFSILITEGLVISFSCRNTLKDEEQLTYLEIIFDLAFICDTYLATEQVKLTKRVICQISLYNMSHHNFVFATVFRTQLNRTMTTSSGVLQPTSIHLLPVLFTILLFDIRRSLEKTLHNVPLLICQPTQRHQRLALKVFFLYKRKITVKEKLHYKLCHARTMDL